MQFYALKMKIVFKPGRTRTTARGTRWTTMYRIEVVESIQISYGKVNFTTRVIPYFAECVSNQTRARRLQAAHDDIDFVVVNAALTVTA